MNDYSIINVKNVLNIETLSIIIFNNIDFNTLKKNLNQNIVNDFFTNQIKEIHLTTQEEYLKRNNGKVIIFKK